MLNVNDPTIKSNFQLKTASSSLNSSSNFKLKDLLLELERKDLVIQHLQAQLSSTQAHAKTFQILKAEPNFSELNNQLMICQKDKTIKELDSIIKFNTNDSHNLKKSLIDKEGDLNRLKQEVNEANVKLKNVQLRLKAKEDEVASLNNDYEQRHSHCESEKKQIENKTNQIVDMMKQYAKELSEASIQKQSLETEKQSLLSINQSLANQINEYSDKQSSYERRLTEIIHLTEENNESNQKISALRNELSKEKQFNAELNRRNMELEDMRSSLMESTNTIMLMQQDNETLKRQCDELNFKVQKLCQADEAIEAVDLWLSAEISMITEWISTYMGIYYDYDIKAIAPSDTLNRSKTYLPENMRRTINTFKQFLHQKRNNINKELHHYEEAIEQSKAQLHQLLLQIDHLQSNNKDLNQTILKQKEDIQRSLIKREAADNSIIASLTKEMSNLKATQAKEREQNEKALSHLNEVINEDISSILHKEHLSKFYEVLIQRSPSSEMFEPNLKSIVEDSLNKLSMCLRAIIKDYELVQLLTKENEVLKKENEGLMKKVDLILLENELKLSQCEARYANDKLVNDQVHKDRLRTFNDDNDTIRNEREEAIATIQLLEKRIKNMQTEIELKEMQIRSQEQIINRRVQQTGNPSEAIITSLERDKTKLIEDNITLIKDNCQLKESVNELRQELSLSHKK